MKYYSTRNKSLNCDFRSIFERGLAPDGGLFIPKGPIRFSEEEISELSKLSYLDLAAEIIYSFCKENFSKDDVSKIVKKSYSKFNHDNDNL